ncbi:MAG: dihydrodipicolinate synthase family protein [Gemmatimonadota bacterium]|nr:dihydrodipicolinate synthase family protein [Gemmatimonadota bacterium]
MTFDVRARLRDGLVIPAHPLALTAARKLDERRQRALTRYYLSAGASGIAVGVHTTQFAIRDPDVGLFAPVLELAATVMDEHEAAGGRAPVRVAGILGGTTQASAEAAVARDCGYQVGLVSLAGLHGWSIEQLIDHVRSVGEIIPVMAFYLQPAVGGRDLPFAFWQQLVQIESVVAIKIAPFDRYSTLDVIRAVAEAGRGDEIALYTGNDDHILLDLLTPFQFGSGRMLQLVGGVLGQWALWTHCAVALHAECRAAVSTGAIPRQLLQTAAELTDANGAIFDAANGYGGCIAGIHEVLRRQGFLEGTWCLDPDEGLSPGQLEEIDRVLAAYPHLADDTYVTEHLDGWLA